MLGRIRLIMLALLGAVAAFSLGCSDSGSGGGGGSVEIQNSNDGQFTGFLWKPRSESNGALVVLLPNALRGNVSGAELHSTDSTSADSLIEVGRFAGDTHNGERPHFRFNGSGGSYGSEIWIIAKTSDGRNLGYFIPNGAGRVD